MAEINSITTTPSNEADRRALPRISHLFDNAFVRAMLETAERDNGASLAVRVVSPSPLRGGSAVRQLEFA